EGAVDDAAGANDALDGGIRDALVIEEDREQLALVRAGEHVELRAAGLVQFESDGGLALAVALGGGTLQGPSRLARAGGGGLGGRDVGQDVILVAVLVDDVALGELALVEILVEQLGAVLEEVAGLFDFEPGECLLARARTRTVALQVFAIGVELVGV